MSPIGGVGVNLAIQDAVACANILARPLREGRLAQDDLAAVEKRRRFPTRATQKLQLMMRGKKRAGRDDADPRERTGPPAFLLWIARLPFLHTLAGHLHGLRFRLAQFRPPSRPHPPRPPAAGGQACAGRPCRSGKAPALPDQGDAEAATDDAWQKTGRSGRRRSAGAQGTARFPAMDRAVAVAATSGRAPDRARLPYGAYSPAVTAPSRRRPPLL